MALVRSFPLSTLLIFHRRHLKRHADLFYFLLVHPAHARILVFILDHIAALVRTGSQQIPTADGIFLSPSLQREPLYRFFTGRKMLMKPSVGRRKEASCTPVIFFHGSAFRPHQGISLSLQNENIRARPMSMSLAVNARFSFRDVPGDGIVRQLNLDVSSRRTAFLPFVQRQLVDVRNKIRIPYPARLLLAFT